MAEGESQQDTEEKKSLLTSSISEDHEEDVGMLERTLSMREDTNSYCSIHYNDVIKRHQCRHHHCCTTISAATPCIPCTVSAPHLLGLRLWHLHGAHV